MASSFVPAGSMASRFPLSNQGSEVCWKGMCQYVSQAPVPPIFVGIKICFSSSSVEKNNLNQTWVRGWGLVESLGYKVF